MRGLDDMERDVLADAALGGCLCDEEHKGMPLSPEEEDASARLVARGLGVLRVCPFGDEHLSATSLGLLALRIDAAIRGAA